MSEGMMGRKHHRHHLGAVIKDSVSSRSSMKGWACHACLLVPKLQESGSC